MTSTQRHAAFERLLGDVARRRARRLGLGFLGTLRKLPPPPLPGEPAGSTRFFLNAVSADGARAGLVELDGRERAELTRAELWAATGEGRAPARPAARSRGKIKA